jgi:hypothetical protein
VVVVAVEVVVASVVEVKVVIVVVVVEVDFVLVVVVVVVVVVVAVALVVKVTDVVVVVETEVVVVVVVDRATVIAGPTAMVSVAMSCALAPVSDPLYHLLLHVPTCGMTELSDAGRKATDWMSLPSCSSKIHWVHRDDHCSEITERSPTEAMRSHHDFPSRRDA